MSDSESSGFGGEMQRLKEELERQSAELLEVRMKSGELSAETSTLRQRLDVLNEINLPFDTYTNLKSVLDHYLQVILKITGTEAGSILLIEDGRLEPDELAFYSCLGPGAERLMGWHISGGKGIAGWVAKNGVPYFSEDVTADPHWDREVSEYLDYKTKDILCVPMKAGGKILGVIEVMNKLGKPFTRTDLEQLVFVSGHASVMVENARLLAGYEEKMRQLVTLTDFAALLNSTLRTEVVRERAIEAATRLMRAEVGSLLLVDEGTDELYFEVALGDEAKQKKIKEIRLKIGEGIAGWVAKEGQPAVINDVQNDSRFFKGADRKTDFVTRNMVCVPVKSKGKVTGVLQAINKLDGRDFSEDDREIFEALANQVAIAIENSKLYDRLRQTFFATAGAMAEAIEKRDPYTGGHTKRVLEYSSIIARHMGLEPDQIERLQLAAVLHDVGKIGVSDLILRKQGPLDDEEYKIMKKHTEYGADIVLHVPELGDILPGIKDHHERVDGRGYPSGLSAGEIPLMARIIAVADTFDAMTTNRPYRAGLSMEYAVSELRRCVGSQFDDKAVEAFIEAIEAGEVQLGEGTTESGGA